MNNEPFIIRRYGKSELAMLYMQGASEKAAMKLLNEWLVWQVGTGYAVHAGSIGKGSYEATQRMAGGEPKTAPSGENPQEVLHTQTGEINSRRDWRTV